MYRTFIGWSFGHDILPTQNTRIFIRRHLIFAESFAQIATELTGEKLSASDVSLNINHVSTRVFLKKMKENYDHKPITLRSFKRKNRTTGGQETHTLPL